jgi:hypothetical protein
MAGADTVLLRGARCCLGELFMLNIGIDRVEEEDVEMLVEMFLVLARFSKESKDVNCLAERDIKNVI